MSYAIVCDNCRKQVDITAAFRLRFMTDTIPLPYGWKNIVVGAGRTIDQLSRHHFTVCSPRCGRDILVKTANYEYELWEKSDAERQEIEAQKPVQSDVENGY